MKQDYQELVERVRNVATSHAENEATFIGALLEALVWHGYTSARFYEVVRDPLAEDEVLVLRQSLDSKDNGAPQVGLRIPLAEATIGNGGKVDVAVGDSDNAPKAARSWIQKLHLEGSRWADVAIRDSDGRLYGLLAVAAPIDYNFKSEDVAYLRQIKDQVAHYESQRRLRKLLQPKKEIADFFSNVSADNTSVADICEHAASVILAASGAQACAIFQYRWASRRLIKVAETFTSAPALKPLKETYFAGEYLTGAAWEDADLRHIPDFQGFLKSRPNLVFSESLRFHSTALGNVHSVMYQPFGHRGFRFLARVMNRRENALLPFNYSQMETLVHTSQELGEFCDDFHSRVVIKEFERVAASGVRNITDYGEPLKTTCEALEKLGFGPCTLIYKAKASPVFEVVHSEEERLKKQLDDKVIVASENAFLARLANENGVRVTRVSDLRSTSDLLTQSLLSLGVVAVVSASSSGDGASLVAVHCIYSPESKLRPGTPLFEHPSDRDFLPAILSILCGVIEGSRSNVSADFAEDLVAHFGHEVATPISKMSSKSIKAVNTAIGALRRYGAGPDLLEPLDAAKDAINDQGRRITHQMKSAIALAERSEGSLDVDFERFAWDGVIAGAWEEALDWRNGMEGRGSQRGVVLLKNPALAGMSSIGDRDLIQSIFANLFKNAIKYSLPRYGGRDMEVRALGQPQTNMDIVQVVNWGVGIPQDKRELIFQKFIRVERTDRIRPIRGMGLGLYIARLYAHVHQGELFCRNSTPTLDDPAREEKLEGFDTCFEMRLPRTTQQGVRKVRID